MTVGPLCASTVPGSRALSQSLNTPVLRQGNRGLRSLVTSNVGYSDSWTWPGAVGSLSQSDR